MHALKSVINLIRRSRKTIVLIAVVATASIMLSAMLAIVLNKSDTLYVPSIGTIYTIGVQVQGGDVNQTNEGLQYFDWGKIYPGTQTNRSLGLRSVSNRDITLELNAADWQPANISDYLDLSWNYTGETLSPQQTIWVMLTLSASPKRSFASFITNNNVTTFSFDIIITPAKR
jgi:hypothetical protein